MCPQPSSPVIIHETDRDDILSITKECFVLIADQVLSWTEGELDLQRESTPESGIIALMPIVSEKRPFHFAIAANTDECEKISRAIFMIDDEEDLPDDIDSADALCEIANMVAGEIKNRLHEQDDSLRLGIPIVLNGLMSCHCCEGQKMANTEIQVGPARILITVLYPFDPARHADGECRD